MAVIYNTLHNATHCSFCTDIWKISINQSPLKRSCAFNKWIFISFSVTVTFHCVIRFYSYYLFKCSSHQRCIDLTSFLSNFFSSQVYQKFKQISFTSSFLNLNAHLIFNFVKINWLDWLKWYSCENITNFGIYMYKMFQEKFPSPPL